MFQEMNIDKDRAFLYFMFKRWKTDTEFMLVDGQPKLQLFALLIGILYISTTGICLWGIAAGALVRLVLGYCFDPPKLTNGYGLRLAPTIALFSNARNS